MNAEGRIKLGDQVVTTPATLLENLRGITVDGQPVQAAEATRLFAFHKPGGMLTAERDFSGRPTIYTALRNALPNIDTFNLAGTLANGKSMQKLGNEHFLFLPVSGQTNILLGTNFVAVVGEGVKVSIKSDPLSSDPSPLRKDVIDAVTRVVHKFYPGLPVVPYQGSGATDGLVFRSIGIPTYAVDPTFMRKKDSFAHGLNERVPVQSFYQGLEIWYLLVKDLAGTGKARK